MTTAKVVETSVTVNNNSSIQDYVHPDDHTPGALFGKYLFGRRLRSIIFGTFVVKFLAWLPLLGFSNKMV